MKFVLYTTKNIKQCTTALTERLKTEETRPRPALHGHVDKAGVFTLTLSTKVAKGFTRVTKLRGKLQREDNITVIRGTVSEGVPRERVRLVMGALAAAGFIIILNGQTMLGILVALLGLAMYIPLVGDSDNSAKLLKELKKTLDAKDKPPS